MAMTYSEKPLGAHRKMWRPPAVTGAEKIGKLPAKSGRLTSGRPRLLPLLAMAAVGLLMVEKLTTKARPEKTLTAAETAGAADGSTAKAGARSHLGHDSGIPKTSSWNRRSW